MSSSNQCYELQQVRRSRVSKIMPIRFNNLATSPYTKYTQQQLDMRRKAEILKYKASNKNTMQNSFTKAQIFSQIVNRRYQNITDNNNCPNTIIHTPTYYSDVPGSSQNLFLDPSVPLYNLIGFRDYPGYYNGINEKWEYVSYTDVICNSDNLIGTIYIRHGIDDTNYSFSLTVPINIYISGLNNTLMDSQLDFTRQISDIYFNSATCYVYYNDIMLNTPNVAKPVSPIAVYSGLYDISLNTINSGGNSFSATVFSGYITFNNINLYTANGYVYDFKVSINAILNLNDNNHTQSDYYSSINYYVIANSSQINDSSNNCIVSTIPHTNKTGSITGTNSNNISSSLSFSAY